MTATNDLKKANVLAFIVPLILILVLFALVNSNVFLAHQDSLSTYIVIDFLVTIPLVYFLLIRKTKISNLTIAPCLIIFVIIASYIFPEAHQNTLDIAKSVVIPIVELSVLTIIFLKVSKAIKAFKSASQEHHDFYSTLQDTCASLFPKTAAKLVANEIALIYYGFFNYKKVSLKDHEFSNYKLLVFYLL